MCKSVKSIQFMYKSVVDLEHRSNVLNKHLDELQKCQQDILHMIENEDRMNVVRGYDLAKALHDIRVVRREVKNELEVLNKVIPKMKLIKQTLNCINQQAISVDKKMKKLSENKVYNNRILSEENDIRVSVNKFLGGAINEYLFNN